MVAECNNVPATIYVYGEWASNIGHAQVHGLVARDVIDSTVCLGVFCLGFGTLGGFKVGASRLACQLASRLARFF
jgi:hypothetical protein